jgi:hypothetical protein
MAQINVQNTKITVLDIDNKDYICLTDMAGAKENDVRAADVIKNWLRNRYTLEFLGTWETIHNPGFKVVEFDHFRKEAGLPTFVLSCSEWIEKTNQLSRRTDGRAVGCLFRANHSRVQNCGCVAQ